VRVHAADPGIDYRLSVSAQGICTVNLGIWYEMRLRLASLRLGRDTMVKVFGWDPEEMGW
jgi:hypothetical protein